MKQNQLAICASFGLVQIKNIVSEFCIYCLILTGPCRGGLTVEYKTTLTPIERTESLQVF